VIWFWPLSIMMYDIDELWSSLFGLQECETDVEVNRFISLLINDVMLYAST
jgi:hypothetical protein